MLLTGCPYPYLLTNRYMYAPTQLEAIRIFGKKELNAWCIAKWKWQENVTDIIAYRIWDTLWVVTYYEWNGVNVERIEEFSIDEYEILWHEPHLEDVFRVADEKEILFDIEKHGLEKWYCLYFYTPYTNNIEYNPTLQLLEQSESTLQQLISLFK